jgi:uncharacterized protein (TIGR03086 family)
LFPPTNDQPSGDLTSLLRARLSTLIDRWPEITDPPVITIADHDIAISVMAGVAALEIAVHGWDLAQASGNQRSIPPDLAADLLAVAAAVLADGNRHNLFEPPVPHADVACPGDRLVAFLGRSPESPVRRLRAQESARSARRR